MRNPLSRGTRRSRNRSRARSSGLTRKWHESKPLRAAAGAVSLALPILVVASSNASAGVNLVVNAGVEQKGAGFPVCWQKSGTGSSTYSIGTTNKAHSGGVALAVSISKYSSGQRLAQIAENTACAPTVIPGQQYNLGLYYMSSSPDTVIELYRHAESGGWTFWMDLKTLPATGKYAYASVRTPVIPAGTDQISFGVALYGRGTLITDDYSMVDATVASSKSVCTAGAACAKGEWQVLPFPSPVRSIHTVMMYTGDVLFIAGSGNDPNEFEAGSFESAVYNPNKGTFQVIPTPDDFFCAGHVQLPNGDVLVLGGNKAYPNATTGLGYEGLNTSYIFDPITLKYYKVNNLNAGHWYPSATELGNGDVISFGGLDATSAGTTVTEYFKYDRPLTDATPSGTGDGSWLPESEINEDNGFWGLYPAMILTQSGNLFYSGSHVFGNNETPVGDDGGVDPDGAGEGNGGAGILGDVSTNAAPYGPSLTDTTPVDGLQDNPGGPAGTDMTDQSMSVLLPPAQAQEVFLAGGGNIDYNIPGTRDTDLIDLNAADPKYTPGPLLPLGKLSNGQTEPSNEGKMYVSLVLLPNGQVFETGGGLINREDPVYGSAMVNPAELEAHPTSEAAYSVMAPDPVPRTYHSQSFLLPDGRVLSIGNNPGDGSFDMRMSVYSPPYLFDGPRPQITGVSSATNWQYGKSYGITTNQPITSAELITPESVTHQSDPNQRFVALPISGSGTKLSVALTSNANIAPPGWYMLFVDNASGVPSVAKWVHIG